MTTTTTITTPWTGAEIYVSPTTTDEFGYETTTYVGDLKDGTPWFDAIFTTVRRGGCLNNGEIVINNHRTCRSTVIASTMPKVTVEYLLSLVRRAEVIAEAK